MKTRLFIILTALLMLAGIGANAQTKYYWCSGTTVPTAENIASIATGSSDAKPNWNGRKIVIK